MNNGFAPFPYSLVKSNQQIETPSGTCNYSVLIPAPTFYLPGSTELYTIPFDKAVPIIKSLGFGHPYPPLPLCVKCKSTVATHHDPVLNNMCDKCYCFELSMAFHKQEKKLKKPKPYKPRNNKICSTCNSRRGCIKNGKKYKTCEECLIKKKEERLRKLNEENIGTINVLNSMDLHTDEE